MGIILLIFSTFTTLGGNGKNVTRKANKAFNDREIDSTINRKFNFLLEYQHLYTTHHTHFLGGSLIVNYRHSKKLYTGLGAEYSYCRFHYDNYWRLTNLKFLPVFLDFKWILAQDKDITLFYHTSEGISFANYSKNIHHIGGKTYNVFDTGFFLYSGFGLKCKLSDKLSSLIDVGFKAYHLSFNGLDINPHWTTLRIGLVF